LSNEGYLTIDQLSLLWAVMTITYMSDENATQAPTDQGKFQLNSRRPCSNGTCIWCV
jgi:hypothetical protein